MKISKWGNSLAIRLPGEVVKALCLKEGDDVTVHVTGWLSLEVEKTPDRRQLADVQ